MNRYIRLSLLAVVLLLSGCAAATAPLEPFENLPQQWQQAEPQSAAAIDPEWWRQFGSNELEGLIEQALANSPDLAATAESVIQAVLVLRNSGATLLPSVSASGASSWGRSYDHGAEVWNDPSRSSSVGLKVSYEVDLWGKLAAQRQSSAASYDAVRFDFDAARLTLVSSVAQNYFEYLCLNERLVYARNNLEIAEGILRIVESRWRNGEVTELDVVQQRTTVTSQQSSVLSLEVQIRQTRNALAVLTGSFPQDFAVAASGFSNLLTPSITTGVPSELLLRRPDLAAAEADLIAADADIRAARAELFPSFSLSASASMGSAVLLSLTDPTSSLSLAGSLAQTLFDGGSRRNQIKISESKQRALIENYRQAVLTAFQEVEDALLAESFAVKQAELQEQTVASARRTLELSQVQYKNGVADLNTVLTAQQSKNQADDELLQLRLERLTNLVTLYKVLGGGWERQQAATGPDHK